MQELSIGFGASQLSPKVLGHVSEKNPLNWTYLSLMISGDPNIYPGNKICRSKFALVSERLLNFFSRCPPPTPEAEIEEGAVSTRNS